MEDIFNVNYIVSDDGVCLLQFVFYYLVLEFTGIFFVFFQNL